MTADLIAGLAAETACVLLLIVLALIVLAFRPLAVDGSRRAAYSVDLDATVQIRREWARQVLAAGPAETRDATWLGEAR